MVHSPPIETNNGTKQMGKIFEFYTDTGHGWLRVSHKDVAASGLDIATISRYSYQDGCHAYLEEDADADRFISAWTEKFGTPTCVEMRERGVSPIRKLARFA